MTLKFGMVVYLFEIQYFLMCFCDIFHIKVHFFKFLSFKMHSMQLNVNGIWRNFLKFLTNFQQMIFYPKKGIFFLHGKNKMPFWAKAGYTATPVACGWAGAVIEVTSSFGQVQWGQRLQKPKKSKVWWTDRRTDGQTDKPTKR